MARRSRMSRPTRPSATRRARSRGSTTRCTTRSMRDLLTTVDDFGIRTHKFFKPSKTAQELVEAREAIAAWARMSYGFMGRTPDYKAAFMASLGRLPGVLRAVRRERAGLVQALRLAGPLPQPRAGQPAGRSQEAGPRGRRCLHPRRQGDATPASDRQRREDAGDRLGADARDLRGAELVGATWRRARPRTSRSSSSRRCRYARDEADLPHLVRGQAARSPFDNPLSAASTRTTPSWSSTTR